MPASVTQKISSALFLTVFSTCSVLATQTNDVSLKNRLERLEKELQELRAKTETPESPHQNESGSGFKFKFGGRIKVDAFYDVDSRGPVFGLDPTSLPLRGLDTNNKGHFKLTPLATRLFTEAQQTFDTLATRAFIEIDFARSPSYSSTAFMPRIRHAYVELGNFLIGQTWYTFQDLDAFVNTLDNLYGGSRQTMVRYTHKFSPCLSLAIAAEDPNTEYFDSRNNNVSDNNDIGKSKLPDLAAQLRFKHSHGHVAFSAVGRKLEVNSDLGAVAIQDSKYGWGLGFTGRYNFYGKSGLIWQINGGKGIGRYIDDLSQAVYIENSVIPLFSTIRAANYIVGIEAWFTDKLTATVAASITRISKPKAFVNDSTNYNRHQDRYHVNLIYKLLPTSDVGLEVMHYRRRAGITTDNNGKDTRILASFIYNFSL